MDKRPHFGDRVRELREQSGMSRSELAGALGVTVAAVCNWEAGQTPLSRSSISRMREVLSLDDAAVVDLVMSRGVSS